MTWCGPAAAAWVCAALSGVAAVWFALAASAAREEADRLRERMAALREDRRYRARVIRTWDAGRPPDDPE